MPCRFPVDQCVKNDSTFPMFVQTLCPLKQLISMKCSGQAWFGKLFKMKWLGSIGRRTLDGGLMVLLQGNHVDVVIDDCHSNGDQQKHQQLLIGVANHWNVGRSCGITILPIASVCVCNHLSSKGGPREGCVRCGQSKSVKNESSVTSDLKDVSKRLFRIARTVLFDESCDIFLGIRCNLLSFTIAIVKFYGSIDMHVISNFFKNIRIPIILRY